LIIIPCFGMPFPIGNQIHDHIIDGILFVSAFMIVHDLHTLIHPSFIILKIFR